MTFWGIVGAVCAALGIFYGGCVILFLLFGFVAKKLEKSDQVDEADNTPRE